VLISAVDSRLEALNLKMLTTLGWGSDSDASLINSSTPPKSFVRSRSPVLPLIDASSIASSKWSLEVEGVTMSLTVTLSSGLLLRVRLSKVIPTADPVHVSPSSQKVTVESPVPAFTVLSMTEVTSHSYQLLLEVTVVTDILSFLEGPLFHVTVASAQPVDPEVSNTAITAELCDTDDTYSLSVAERTSACEARLDASNLKMLTMLCSPSVGSGSHVHLDSAIVVRCVAVTCPALHRCIVTCCERDIAGGGTCRDTNVH